MSNKKNIKHQLEISCAILHTNIAALGRKWGVSRTWVERVAEGWGTSESIRGKILDTIQEAQKVVPFSYSTNEQLNEQAKKNENPRMQTA